jgi:hypothetical protein
MAKSDLEQITEYLIDKMVNLTDEESILVLKHIVREYAETYNKSSLDISKNLFNEFIDNKLQDSYKDKPVKKIIDEYEKYDIKNFYDEMMGKEWCELYVKDKEKAKSQTNYYFAILELLNYFTYLDSISVDKA